MWGIPLELLLEMVLVGSLLSMSGHAWTVLRLWSRRHDLLRRELRFLRKMLLGGAIVMMCIAFEFLAGLYFGWRMGAFGPAALCMAYAALLYFGSRSIAGPIDALDDPLAEGYRWGVNPNSPDS